MPVNKDAMARYRIIDRMLADPHKDYTTKEIEKAVSRECPKVSTRMIQKDIKALEEEFGKAMVRNKGGRGTVRYEDQATPLFYQELTSDEEEILKEALSSLGQFEGLENFKWLEILKRKLDMPHEKKERPVISFAKNDILQIPENLLGHLYSAISRRKVIRFGYRKFQDAGKPFTSVTVYPYQLRQYNNRWFLLGKNPDYTNLSNIPLDRIDSIKPVHIPFIANTEYDFDSLFDNVIGVTVTKAPVEDIKLRFTKKRLQYILTKPVHKSQVCNDPETGLVSLKVVINKELEALLLSYGPDVEVLSPESLRKQIQTKVKESFETYFSVQTGCTTSPYLCTVETKKGE